MLLSMLWLCIAAMPKATLSWPIGAWGDTALGYDLTTDYLDGFYGPWNYDYRRGSRWPGFLGARSYGYAAPVDFIDDFGSYPRTTDVSKENYIRDDPFGGTEFGMRDSLTIRPGIQPPLSRYSSLYLPSFLPRPYGLRSLDRFYPPYGADDLVPDRISPYYKRLFASGLAVPRPSSLRTGGDNLYLRR